MPEIHVFMVKGRSNDEKKNFMRALTQAVNDHLGYPIEGTTVQLFETPLEDKMKGGFTYVEKYGKV